ncbi:MAG: ATP-binding cassette domain-containing protein, partial [Bdellovibrionales bacterium]
MSSELVARHLTKRYGDCVSVDDVSLSFEPGRIHAVLGENGAGKTTLMKLLFGLVEPTGGEILLGGQIMRWQSSMDAIRAGLGMVQQHFTLVETLSAIDNIMLGAEVCSRWGGLNRKAAIARIEKLLPSRQLAVPWNALVRDLSVGQKQRLEILKLLFRESQILFLDEPTAVLAPGEIEDFFTVLRQLKAQGRTIVLITHKINEVLSVCDTYTVLRAGKLQARGEVATASADEIVERMIGRKIPEFSVERKPASPQMAFSLDQIKVFKGEIVGIAGVEGSGQNQLVDAAMGLVSFTGKLEVLGQPLESSQTAKIRALGVGLIPEDRQLQGLWLDESCTTNMTIGLEEQFLKHGIFQNAKQMKITAGWAKDFDVRS